MVLIRTDTTRYWGENGSDHAKTGEHDSAGIEMQVAKWLVEEKDAMMIGSDTSGLENVPPSEQYSQMVGGSFNPVHVYLLMEQGRSYTGVPQSRTACGGSGLRIRVFSWPPTQPQPLASHKEQGVLGLGSSATMARPMAMNEATMPSMPASTSAATLRLSRDCRASRHQPSRVMDFIGEAAAVGEISLHRNGSDPRGGAGSGPADPYRLAEAGKAPL